MLAVAVLLVLVAPSGALAAGVSAPAQVTPRYSADAMAPSIAPENPDFAAYMLRYRLSPLAPLYSSGELPERAGQHGTGYVPPPVLLGSGASSQGSGSPSGLSGNPVSLTSTPTPRSYDLRALGKLTPVRDQGPNGCCWAFGTYSSLESYLMPSVPSDFSEDHLALDSGFWSAGATTDQKYNNGGNYSMSTAYMARWTGPVNESDQPYGTGYVIPGLTARKHLQDTIILPARTVPTTTTLASMNDPIKQAVMTYGAVGTAFYADITNYYNSSTFAYYYNGATNTPSNHAVAIVGWNDDFPASNFNSSAQPPGDGAWIVRNSWGSGWGDGGYFYASYYDSIFANAGNTVFDSAEPVVNYDHVLQYDPLGVTATFSWGGGDTAWFKNKFKVSNRSNLTAVSFYADRANAPYVVYVGAGGPPSQVASGTLANAGYHTIALPAPVPVSAGATLTVEVQLTVPGDTSPFDMQYPIAGYSDQSTATPGVGFVSQDGTHWTDITSFWANTDVPLKAFLTDSGPTTSISGVPSGWTNGDVTFSLSAHTDSGSIAHTYYALNGGAAITYAAPVTISSEGTTTISYYSVDTSGNVETAQSATVLIDKTPPATTDDHVSAYPMSATVHLTPADSMSGVATTTWTLDSVVGGGLTVSTSVPGTHTLVYRSFDNAGNAEATHTVAFKITNGWITQTSPNTAALNGVAFTSNTNGWAVGSNATLLHTTDRGTTWSTVSVPVAATTTLNSVAFSGSNAIIASSGGGAGSAIYLRTTNGGSTWTTVAVPGGGIGVAYAGSSGSVACAAGPVGRILRTTDGGATWNRMTSGTSNTLHGVAFMDANNGWAVGDGGTIVYTPDGGATWYPQTSNTTNALWGGCTQPGNGWIVGTNGTILHSTDGATWVAQNSGTTANLYGVAFTDTNHGWAVGTGGTILSTADGGAHWTASTQTLDGFSGNYRALAFADATHGWAVTSDTPGRIVACVPAEFSSVSIPDATLNTAVRAALSIPSRPINQTDMLGLTSLGIWTYSGTPVTSLEGLQYAKNLTSLTINGNDFSSSGGVPIPTLAPLAGNTNLTTLNLHDTPVSDFSMLSALTSLRTLDLYYSGLPNLSGVSALTGLTSLNVGGNGIGDISALSSLPNVTTLWLSNSGISSLAPLASLTNLTYLDFGGNQVTDLSPLRGLSNLQSLYAESNRIWDISAIDNLPLNFANVTENYLNLAPGTSDARVVADLRGRGATVLDTPQVSDTTAPSTTLTWLSPASYASTWTSQPVSFTLSATDPDSPFGIGTYYALGESAVSMYTAPVSVTAEGTTTVSYYSVDPLGNTEATNSATVLIDTTAPSTVASLSGTPGNAGWWRSAVTATLASTDSESGVAHTYFIRNTGYGTSAYSVPLTYTTDGTKHLQFWAVDDVGNVESTNALDFRIDTTAPTTTDDHVATYSVSAEISLTATDSGSGVASTGWTLDGVPGNGAMVTTSVLGGHTLAYASTDVAGNVEGSHVVTFTVLPPPDTTPPVTTLSWLSPLGYASTWTSQSVSFSLVASDADSPSGISTYFGLNAPAITLYASPVQLSAEGTTTVSYFSVDLAGNAEATRSAQVRIDKTPPQIVGAPTTMPNASGWYVAPMTVHFAASDALSGLATVTPDVVLSDGVAQSVAGTAVDVAGNAATFTVSGINVDTVSPSTSVLTTTSVATSAVGLSWSAAADTGSGVACYSVYGSGGLIATTMATSYTVRGLSPGSTFGFWVTATDVAGNTSAPSNTVSGTTPLNPAPVTTATIAPPSPDGNAGWYRTVPSITLSSSGSTIHYSWTSALGPWTTYTTTLTAPEGLDSLHYYANAAGASTETVKSTLVAVDSVAPSPSVLTTTSVATSTVGLSWTAATDVTSGVDHYSLYRSDGTLIATTTGTSWTVRSLLPRTAYGFYVTASDVAGNLSAPSPTLSVTTAAEPPTGPVVPDFANRIAYSMPGLRTASFRGTFDHGGTATLKVSTSLGTKLLFSGTIVSGPGVRTLATWDGTVGGKQLAAGNYRWTLSIRDTSGHTTTYTGTVGVSKYYYSFSGTGTGATVHYSAVLGKGTGTMKISATQTGTGATIGVKLSGPTKLSFGAYAIPAPPKSLAKTLALSGKTAIRATGACDIAVNAGLGVRYIVTIVQ